MKYHIAHKKNGNERFIVFTSKLKMLDYLNENKSKLNKLENVKLTKSLNIKYETPKDTAEIHQGAGWQYPLKKNKKKIDKQN